MVPAGYGIRQSRILLLPHELISTASKTVKHKIDINDFRFFIVSVLGFFYKNNSKH